MRAIVIGIGSDIGREVATRLLAEGWTVTGTWYTNRPVFDQEVRYVNCDLSSKVSVANAGRQLWEPWDLVFVASGTYTPLGSFFSTDVDEWEMCLQINALSPLRLLRDCWHARRPGASVCFLAGPNPNRANPTYSAYVAAKAILHKFVEDVQAETPDIKFFILGPGLTRTKMLNETLKAGVRAAFYDRVLKFVESGAQGTSFDDIYGMLKAAMVGDSGGRNIHVGDDWRQGIKDLPLDTFKLRRKEINETR